MSDCHPLRRLLDNISTDYELRPLGACALERVLVALGKGAEIFQKYARHKKILGARAVTRVSSVLNRLQLKRDGTR